MKTFRICITFLILFSFSNSAYSQFLGIGGIKYIFPNATLKPKDVCGKNKCLPGQNNGRYLNFTINLFAPEINDAITEEDIVLSVLGRTVKENDLYGSTPFTCSDTGQTPFTISDITKIGTSAYKVKLEKKSTLNLNITSAVEANMKEIKKLTNDSAKLASAEAKIKLAYEKVNGKELSVNAVYTEWMLTSNVINGIKAGNEKYKECKTFLTSRPYRLITAIGLVSYDMTFEQNSVSKLADEIQTELESELGIKAGFSFTFKKEVTKDVLAQVENGYSIPVWEHSKEKILNP